MNGMKLRWKILLFILGSLLLGAIVAANFLSGPRAGTPVFTEKIARHDLEAIVRESGRVRAKTSVPLSANTVGQIKDVLVKEGERVKAGQLLIQIDPTPFETAIAQTEAAVNDAEKRLEIARTQLARTRKKLERERALGTMGTGERKDELESDLAVQEREVEAAQLHVTSENARLDRDRHELTKVAITAPIDGVALRVNVEKGQNTVMGTMNSGGTELMTIADLSVLQVELDVGEAAILDVKVGQEASVEMDALPNRKLKGKVTEVGTSPLPDKSGQDRGVAFKVVVTLAETVDGVRPGFSASAGIVTATRAQALAVPIRALVARDLPVNAKEEILRGADVPKDAKKKSFEGVMAVKDDKVRFTPVKVGISGKEHFELLEGLAEGDELVTGPHKSLRELKDDEAIQRRSE